MNNMGAIGRHLASIRKRKEISISKLATKVNISESILYKIEEGAHRLKLDQFCLICEVLGINPNEALGFEDQSNRYPYEEDLVSIHNILKDVAKSRRGLILNEMSKIATVMITMAHHKDSENQVHS
jgi:transcriptional regulator with XRE-family HTH domain